MHEKKETADGKRNMQRRQTEKTNKVNTPGRESWDKAHEEPKNEKAKHPRK